MTVTELRTSPGDARGPSARAGDPVGARPTLESAMPTPTWRYLGFLLGPAVGTFAFNAIAVTLPQVQLSFGASDASVELVVAGYGIPFAVLLILGGRLGDRFGRHRLFTMGMSLFLVSAMVCSFAPNMGSLIAGRVLQGVGAALCTPQVLATIQATSTGTARARGIAAFGASAGIGAAIGQVLGGVFAEFTVGGLAGWRATYWVIAAIALAAMVLSVLAPRSRSHESVTIDLLGTVGLGAGLLLIASAATFGPSWSWSWPIFVALVVGVVVLVATWKHQNHIERNGRIPLLPPSVLRLRPLRLGLLAAGLFFAGYAALLYVVPRALGAGLGISAVGTGLTLLPFAVVFAAVSLNVARVERYTGARTLVWGVAIQAAALVGVVLTVALAWSPSLPYTLQPALIVLGVGQALVFAPLTQAVVKEVPVEAAGLSGGMFGTVQQLALSLGVILVGGIVTATGWHGHAELLAGTILDLGIVVVVLGLAITLTASPAPRVKAIGHL